MDALLSLRAFAAVAHSGSFSAAARQLGVVTSVVTKRVDQLERHIKAKLFMRSTRRVVLTEAGQQWLSRAQAAVVEVDDVLAGMSRTSLDIEGHLRVKLPTTLAVLYLGAIVSRFQAQHPRVSLDVVLADRALNPIEEGFDLAVSVFPAAFPGVVDEPLCPLRRLVCAAPAYLSKRGMPRHPRELAEHDTLDFLPTGPVWSFESRGGPVSVAIRPKFSANDGQVLLAAAREGNGIALLPSYVAGPALRDGSLVAVLDGFSIGDIWIKALMPANRSAIPRVRKLVGFLREGLSPIPPWELT